MIERNISWLIDFYDTNHAAQQVTDRERLRHAAAPLRRFFGAMSVADLDDVQFVRYENGRRAGENGRPVGASTVRRELQHLQAVVRFASRNVKHTAVRRDDVPHFALPPKAEPRNLVLTDAQMDAMMASVQPANAERLTAPHIFLALARWTAARRNAIERLTWDRVDFEGGGRIDYREPGRTQTNKRRVPVPMDRQLRPILERAFAERAPGDPFVIPGAASSRKSRGTAARLAGVPDATAHTFRHTWATRKILAGVAPALVAAFMGDSVQTVLTNYVHVTESDVASILSGQDADAVSVSS